MLLILAVAMVGFAAYYLAELATAPMRTRRNLVHRAANYGREKTGGKEDWYREGGRAKPDPD